MAKPRAQRHSWYSQIGVNQKNFARLRKLRADLGHAMGIKLSWNDFIGQVLPSIEEGVKKETSK